MIQYTKTAADHQNRIKEMTWMRGRLFVFGAAGVFVLMVFFFLVGVTGNNSEAIQFAIYTATLFAVLTAMYLILYFKFKKAVVTNFENNAVDGKIDFTIDKLADGTLEFARLTDEESFTIEKYQIKTIRSMKNIHVILLRDGRTIDLPRRADIDEFVRNI